MKELIDKLLFKGYDSAYIHWFLSVREIGQPYQYFVGYASYSLGTQLQVHKEITKKNIEEALIEVDFLRPA